MIWDGDNKVIWALNLNDNIDVCSLKQYDNQYSDSGQSNWIFQVWIRPKLIF